MTGDAAAVERIVSDVTGSRPRELRFLRTDAGLVAYLTLGLDGATSLDDAHARASEIEARIRVEAPEIADVVVHTEPAAQRHEALHVQPEGACELERGWPGRIDGDQIVQLAAQTLQAFFTGGGGAREHATYELADVRPARARALPARDPPVRAVQERRDAVLLVRQPPPGARARGGAPASRRAPRSSTTGSASRR